MNLLDRYVLALFLRVLLWALLSFISIFLLVDLFDHLDNFIDDSASFVSVLKYYGYQMPWVADLCLPVGMLLASLFTIGILSKNNEYTAILASGVSLLRLTRTLLLLGLLVSVGALVFREAVVPESKRRQEEVKEHEIGGKPRRELKGKSDFAHIGQNGEMYVVNRFRPDPPTLFGVSIQAFDDSTMTRRIDSQRADWQEGRWVLNQGTVREFTAEGERVRQFYGMALEESLETPSDFSKRDVDPENMSYLELSQFASFVERTGGNPVPYQASLAHKLSFPLVNLVMVVLGLALGAARRKTTVFAGFGLTILLAFVYYLFMDFGLSLGKAGTVPAWASAWTGNILYGAAGILLFAKANR